MEEKKARTPKRDANAAASASQNHHNHHQQNHQPSNQYHSNQHYNPFASNNKIRKMPVAQLAGALRQYKLCAEGDVAVLRKRLFHYAQTFHSHEHQHANASTDLSRITYDYLLVVDFEATCEETNPPDYRHEIIEFPIVLYDAVTGKMRDQFHAYCRPQVNPRLTDFCERLTGITQATVDAAAPFSEVLSRATEWMGKHRLHESGCAVLCDCNTDMSKFLRLQCNEAGLEMPGWARHWINLRKEYRQYYAVNREAKWNLQEMLAGQGLTFEGRQHSGLDDAHNILRVARQLIVDGCELRVNEKFDGTRPPSFSANVSRSESKMLRRLPFGAIIDPSTTAGAGVNGSPRPEAMMPPGLHFDAQQPSTIDPSTTAGAGVNVLQPGLHFNSQPSSIDPLVTTAGAAACGDMVVGGGENFVVPGGGRLMTVDALSRNPATYYTTPALFDGGYGGNYAATAASAYNGHDPTAFPPLAPTTNGAVNVNATSDLLANCQLDRR